ncbi:histidine kinase, partial [Vibrio parahaemolyticus]|nr:histidine kinase [Vibrio parahaemolyticus]
HLLVSRKCHLDLMSHRLQDEKLKSHLDKSQLSLVTAINEVRHISHQLRPSALDDIGLEAALTTVLPDFQSHSGSDIDSHFAT